MAKASLESAWKSLRRRVERVGMRSVARMPPAGDYTQHRKCAHHEEREAIVSWTRTERREGAVRTALTFAVLSVASAGCALAYRLDDYSIEEPNKGSALAPDARDGAVPEQDAPSTACTSNAECVEVARREGRDEAVVCVRSKGTCAALRSGDCPTITGDFKDEDAVVVGALLHDDRDPSLERAGLLAADEIDAVGLPARAESGRARPLVVVSCDARGDVVRAARHLAEDLGVVAIVGPVADDDAVRVTQQVTSRAGTLVLSPSAAASSLSELSDNGLTFRNVPSDAQRAKLVIDQLNELETLLRSTRSLTSVKFALPHASDVGGQSVRDSIATKLLLNGRFLNDAFNASFVSVDAYGAPGDAAQKALVTKYADVFKPDLVMVTAEDQIQNLVIPLEKALTAARATVRPYYVAVGAARTRALLDAIQSGELPADIKRRIRGVGAKPDTDSEPVIAAFVAAYTAKHGAPSAPTSIAPAYDAVYAIAAAVSATPKLAPTGASVAEGLRRIGVGQPMGVGAGEVEAVLRGAASGDLSLRGTLSPMRWDPNGDILGGTLEVWCIGGTTSSTFGGSGRAMDVQSQVIGGRFVQCQ